MEIAQYLQNWICLELDQVHSRKFLQISITHNFIGDFKTAPIFFMGRKIFSYF